MSDGEIQYVRTEDGLHLAYQVRGDGPLAILEIGGFGTLFPLDAADEQPRWHRFEERLRRFARVIKFDLRGLGYSDPFSESPTVDDWVSDALAVLDAVGVDRVAVFASSFGGPAAVQFAAEHPHRVNSLVLANAGARFTWAEDYPIGVTQEVTDELRSVSDPGTVDDEDRNDIDIMAPSLAGDADIRRWWSRSARRGAGPAVAAAIWDVAILGDARAALPSIDAPTLVIVTTGDRFITPVYGRWLADHIPGADLCEIEAGDQVVWAVPDDLVVNEIEQFLTGSLARAGGTRSIQAVLFTDIVESTWHNTEKGDRAWLELLGRHDDLASHEVNRRGGRLVKRLGDGVLAVFPLASDAIEAGIAITSGARELGIAVRAGIHVAEVDEVGDDVLGLGVTIAARVLGEAGDGEVLATRAVADLLAGSSFAFEPHARRALKGVAGEWELVGVRRQ